MNKKKYETPVTTRTTVELENGFMAGSVRPDDPIETGDVTIKDQTQGIAIGGSGDGWTEDNTGWD